MARQDRRHDALHRARFTLGERLQREVGFAALRVNRSLRDELLNGEIFYSLAEARVLIEAWRRHYNTVRPHSSLGYRKPAPEAVPSPVPPYGSATLHLRPTLAMEVIMH